MKQLFNKILDYAKQSKTFSDVSIIKSNGIINDGIYIKSKLKGESEYHKNDFDEYEITDGLYDDLILHYLPSGYVTVLNDIEDFITITRADEFENKNTNTKGITIEEAEVINDWLAGVWVNEEILPESVLQYTQEHPLTHNWDFGRNDDGTINIIFPNNVIVVVNITSNNKIITPDDVNHVKNITGDIKNNVSTTHDINFTYEQKIYTSITEFKKYLKNI